MAPPPLSPARRRTWAPRTDPGELQNTMKTNKQQQKITKPEAGWVLPAVLFLPSAFLRPGPWVPHAGTRVSGGAEEAQGSPGLASFSFQSLLEPALAFPPLRVTVPEGRRGGSRAPYGPHRGGGAAPLGSSERDFGRFSRAGSPTGRSALPAPPQRFGGYPGPAGSASRSAARRMAGGTVVRARLGALRGAGGAGGGRG